MTTEIIDKLMKSYWDERFNDAYLGDFCGKGEGWDADWYGVVMKKTDGTEKLIVGHTSGNDDDTWYYDGKMFSNGEILFNLTIRQFNMSMVRYINKKYNLNVKSVS